MSSAPEIVEVHDLAVRRSTAAAAGRPRFTDAGNARRFADHHRDDLQFCHSLGCWFVWDGSRWARDVSGEIDRRARRTVERMHDEARRLRDDERASLRKHALRSESKARLDAMVALARSEPDLAVRADALDAQPFLLNVLNGTLDLSTAVLREHRRDDRLTQLAPVHYDAGALCPRWDAFLARAMGGDVELLTYLQLAAGYSLTASAREQCLFLLHGGGANGKSTYLEVLRALLGDDYARAAEFSTFLERTNDGPRNDIARLRTARIVTSSESGQGRRLNDSLVKSLTGGDMISARFLYQESFEFRPTFKIWLAANHKPQIRSTDEGTWRRMRLIPFSVQIPESERDPHLLDALKAELPGILNWAIAGARQWQRAGLPMPRAVRAATSEYRADSDVIGAFVTDRCDVGPGLYESASDLYAAYAHWCEANGERKLSQRGLGLELSERGHTAEKKSGSIRRCGLALRPAARRTKDDGGPYSGISPI